MLSVNFLTFLVEDSNMINWGNILDDPIGCDAIEMFAEGQLNCEEVQQVFRAGKNRKASGQVRNLIRTRGTKEARQIARKALKRRGLV